MSSSYLLTQENILKYSQVVFSHIFSEFLFIMALIFLFTQVFSFHIKRNESAEEFLCVVLRQWNDNLIQKSYPLCPRDLQVTKYIQLERYIFKSLSHTTLTYWNFQGPQENAVNLTSSHTLQLSLRHKGKIKSQISLLFLIFCFQIRQCVSIPK